MSIHGNAGIFVQIDARTGQHPYLPVGDDPFVQEELGVLLILEEHRLCLAQGAAIHHRHHGRQHRLFKRRAQSLHVGDVWDTLGLASSPLPSSSLPRRCSYRPVSCRKKKSNPRPKRTEKPFDYLPSGPSLLSGDSIYLPMRK